MSAALVDLRARILANALTADQQTALADALAAIENLFPSPDEISNSIPQGEEALAREWFAALYAINAIGVSPLPPNQVSVLIVPTIALLSAVDVTHLPDGSPARVESNGSKWELTTPAPPLAVDGITIAASPTPGRVWQRSGSYIIEAAQLQPVWNVDPVFGNDEANGSSSPIRSLGEIFRRWGTVEPNLSTASPPVINVLGDIPATDPWIARAAVTIRGQLIATSAPNQIGVVTPVNHVAGTKPTVTAALGPAGFWSAHVGELVVTPTAYFWVDSDLGGATAEITTSFSLPALASPTRLLPTPGETFSTFRCPALPVLNPVPIDGLVILNCDIQSPTSVVETDAVLFVACSFNLVTIYGVLRPASGNLYTSCYQSGLTGGGFLGAGFYNGGSLFNVALGTIQGQRFNCDFDGYINQPQFVAAPVALQIGTCFGGIFAGNPFIFFPVGNIAIDFEPLADGQPVLWGPCSLQVNDGVQCHVAASTTAAACLLNTGGLAMDGSPNAFTFNPVTGTFSVGPVAMSPAGLDVDRSYQNPATGSRLYIA